MHRSPRPFGSTLISFAFALVFLAVTAAPIAAFAALVNFAEVSSGIYRGARPQSTSDFNSLKKLGIKTVVDLQGGDILDSEFGLIAGFMEPGESLDWIAFEKRSIESRGMNFVNVPINSLDSVNSVQGYGIGKVIAMMADPANLPIYVHCEHGVDRTGLVIALYRVYDQKWKRQAAHDEMVAMGHGIFRQLFTGDMDRFFWAATKGMP